MTKKFKRGDTVRATKNVAWGDCTMEVVGVGFFIYCKHPRFGERAFNVEELEFATNELETLRVQNQKLLKLAELRKQVRQLENDLFGE